MAPDTRLLLRAEDAEDLAVISAVVQDALISVKDLTYERAERRFTVVANRFRWESRPDGADGGAAFERTLCALSFAGVASVSYRGFRRRDDERILSLLAIRPGNKPGTIELEFSGGAALRLAVSEIRVYATDRGDAWPTAWQPDHEAGDTP
ncbi:MAG TPA: DUF2948 family protein [Stellaceae bacterium]|nr:DUF2948 family protein [Stellaceae bacterium]